MANAKQFKWVIRVAETGTLVVSDKCQNKKSAMEAALRYNMKNRRRFPVEVVIMQGSRILTRWTE